MPAATLAATPSDLLAEVGRIVDADLAPLVRRIDQEGLYPEAVLRALGAAGAFAAHAAGPGGRPGRLAPAIAAMARVGRECLSTAFCTWCQDALVWYLVSTGNDALRDRLLGPAARGERLGGTGLSNPLKALSGIEPLRLSAEAVNGGYVVRGQLPWVSNLGPGHLFGTIFEVASGRRVMALVDCAWEGVKLGEVGFVALDGTRTYSVLFKDVFVPDDHVLADPAEPFVARIRPGFILLQAGMALGLIRGCLDIMEQSDRTLEHVNRYLPDRPEAIRETLDALTREVEALAASPYEQAPEHRRRLLQARLAAGEASLRAANAAMLHAGARGYVRNGAAQRRLREAYFIAIVTPALKHLRKELAADEDAA
ncbi:acyl-CoA dehydrogenase family protein [Azospirillum sp.]|uniref:acyl-CoA dehydrogenase family protein n=1 Tax=Azospirillum sp. TaxID=34012 RepID=UPI002D478712|nr:acyl-CoA dehydrogenase family protein [Azospirillum sp.]HYD69921.1 acyl-CoA dehydrogenase family protein [Azospirillum sp.]